VTDTPHPTPQATLELARKHLSTLQGRLEDVAGTLRQYIKEEDLIEPATRAIEVARENFQFLQKTITTENGAQILSAMHAADAMTFAMYAVKKYPLNKFRVARVSGAKGGKKRAAGAKFVGEDPHEEILAHLAKIQRRDLSVRAKAKIISRIQLASA